MTKNRTSSIRLTEEQYQFLKENKLSITALLNEIISLYQGENIAFWNKKLQTVYTTVHTIEAKIKSLEAKQTENELKKEKQETEQIKSNYETFIKIIKDWKTITPHYIKQYLHTEKQLSDKKLIQIRNSIFEDDFSYEQYKEVSK